MNKDDNQTISNALPIHFIVTITICLISFCIHKTGYRNPEYSQLGSLIPDNRLELIVHFQPQRFTSFRLEKKIHSLQLYVVMDFSSGNLIYLNRIKLNFNTWIVHEIVIQYPTKLSC